MKTKSHLSFFKKFHFGLISFLLLFSLSSYAWSWESVNLAFSPSSQTAQVDEIIDIDIIAYTDGPNGWVISAMEVGLGWDPDVLQLLGNDRSNEDYTWMGFPPFPFNLPSNETWDDGDAIYIALAYGGLPAPIPVFPDFLTVTTLQFLVLAETEATEVSYLPQHTVVWDGVEPNTPITGDISSVAIVTTGNTCTGDLDGNGVVDVQDFLDLLAAWGPNPGHPADFNNDGLVDVQDFLDLLAAWGPC